MRFFAFFLLSGLFPALALTLWHQHSSFYVVYDDGEYWQQAFLILRRFQAGEAGWWDVYTFGSGRPNIHFLYGFLTALFTGKGVTASSQIALTFFYALTGTGIFAFVHRLCRAPFWAFVVSSGILLHGNYFFLATMFLSEMPFFAAFSWGAYFFLRSDLLEKRGWAAAAGACAGLAICSRPVEGTILLGMIAAYVTAKLLLQRRLPLAALLPQALALATTVALFYFYFTFGTLQQPRELWLLPFVWLLAAGAGLPWKSRAGNYSVFAGTALTAVFAWFTPRLLPMYYWFEAGTHAPQASAAELIDSSALANAADLVWKVSNELVGPPWIALSVALLAVLLWKKQLGAAEWVAAAMLFLVVAVLPGSFVKNPSTREAIDRYYLGEILALQVAACVAICRIPENWLRRMFAGGAIALCLFNLYVLADPLLLQSYSFYRMPAFLRPWVDRATVRVAPRQENHFAISAASQLSALLPNPSARSRIFLAPGNDIAHRYFVLRGLELGHGWRLLPSNEMDPRQRELQERSLAEHFDYVLAGPTEDRGRVDELLKKVKAQKGKRLGVIELVLSERAVHLELYQTAARGASIPAR